MARINVRVRSANRTLENRPEAFDIVRVNVSFDVLFEAVIHRRMMQEILVDMAVNIRLICKDRGVMVNALA